MTAQAKPPPAPQRARRAAGRPRPTTRRSPCAGAPQALHQVDVRAEVDGVVQALHFEKGDRVKQGQVLCEIKLNDRGARAAQAQAQVAQAEKELEVAQELYKEGFRSKTQLAQATAAYEAAKAGAATMDIQLANTQIRAPFAGIVDDRYVDVGDYMRVGDKCAMVDRARAVPGRRHGQRRGSRADRRRQQGERDARHRRDGRRAACASSPSHADPATRTFSDRGRTAQSRRQAARRRQRRHPHSGEAASTRRTSRPASWCSTTRARSACAPSTSGIVRFLPVQIISDGPDGMWVAGLPQRVDVITVGQEFVTNGERVKAVFDKLR